MIRAPASLAGWTSTGGGPLAGIEETRLHDALLPHLSAERGAAATRKKTETVLV